MAFEVWAIVSGSSQPMYAFKKTKEKVEMDKKQENCEDTHFSKEKKEGTLWC